MKKIILTLISVLILSSSNYSQINYLEESKVDKDSRMQWWREAGFGMFIHWGLYSIPAGEWGTQENHAEWIRTTAQIPLETYNKFLNEFNPINFNAEKWVLTAKKAGMKYIVITSKHHDGFCLFDSKYTDFDVMSTPFKRDILKELSIAAKKYNIKLGFYYSIMDWHHPDYLPRRDWETNRTVEGADFSKYIQYMKNQLRELITNYNISLLWFDGEWEGTWKHEYGVDLYNYVRNIKPDLIVNNRVDVGRSGMAGMTREGYVGDFGTPEQEIPNEGFPGVDWESCITMNNHWGYNKNDNNWKSDVEIVKILSNITSKAGNLLLNVGPKSDGTFPNQSIEILQKVGNWIDVNSEAVFNTQPSPFKNLNFGECTQKNYGKFTKLYFTVDDISKIKKLVIPGILNKPKEAYFLADKNKVPLKIKRVKDAIVISLPKIKENYFNKVVILDIYGKPDITNPPLIKSKSNIFINENKIELFSDRSNVEIRYSLDGSMPTINSRLYSHPITLTSSANLYAVCFRDNKPVSGPASLRFEKVIPYSSQNIKDYKAGLKCYYYEGEWDHLPQFEKLQSANNLVVNSIDVSSKKREDNYGFVFEGYIQLPEDAVYTFFTDSDDGSQLFINNILVVDNDGLHGMEMKSGNIALKSGFHKIKVSYFESSGGDNLKILIKTPNSNPSVIPKNLLFH